MVTRRFKKGSVYDALASTSGLDFSPVVQLKTYHSRREDQSADSTTVPKPSNKKVWEKTTSNSTTNNETNGDIAENGTSHATTVDVPHVQCLPADSESKKYSPKESKRNHQSFQEVPVLDKNENSGGEIPICVTTHEKYPSWPVTNVSPNSSATFRSHSWTGNTDYPKEKVGYLRPKKSFKISTNQLQPVLEKSQDGSTAKKPALNCPPSSSAEFTSSTNEQIHSNCFTQANTVISSNSSSKPFDFEAFHTPCIPRCFGETDYNIPSPPQRDVSPSSPKASSEAAGSDSNSFISRYEEVLRQQAQYSTPLTMWNKPTPDTLKDGMDTPFLDRLRLDNVRTWSQSPPPPPPPPQLPLPANPVLLIAAPNPPGNDIELSSENGTWMGSMESSSQGRGLPKWQGSYSDLSTLSTQLSNRSSLFDSGHSTMPESGRLSPQSSCGSTAPSLLLEGPTRAQVVARHGCHREIVAHSARVQQPERHGSESVLYYATGGLSRPKTAMSFNIEDRAIKSPEPLPGPSGLRQNVRNNTLPEEPPPYTHRSQASLTLSQSNCPKSMDAPSSDRHSPKRESRNSNSFSSEDSNLRGEDTSGSSSDVSNVTCISNYKERGATSKSWDAANFHPQNQHGLHPNKVSKHKSFDSSSRSHNLRNLGDKHNSLLTQMAVNGGACLNEPQKLDSCAYKLNEGEVQHRRKQDHRNEEHIAKSRSMDESSRKFICPDTDKRQRVSEPDLKAIQKQAVFSFYQRMSLAESVKGSSGHDGPALKSPSDYDPPPPYEAPSASTKLRMSMPKMSLLPNKYQPQGFDESTKISSNPEQKTCFRPSTKIESQSPLLNIHSKSVPNLVNLKAQNLDLVPPHQRFVTNAQYHPPEQQTIWVSGTASGHLAAKRGSPLAKEEIIPWDQLSSVLEKKREAAEKAQPLSENKDPPEDGSSSSSSATNYFKGHKSPRKVQLKEVHHSNETASVKVITPDGVTLVQTSSTTTSDPQSPKSKEDKSSGKDYHHNHHHHHQRNNNNNNGKVPHKRRPAPPPPPKQPPKRPPPPPPPESPEPTPAVVVILDRDEPPGDVEKELLELRIDERNGQEPSLLRCPGHLSSSSSSPQLMGSYGSSSEAEGCSSPDLPLPPPPPTDDCARAMVTDEPLPPPPETLDVELANRTLDSASLVYPKDSYMSYRSEKKLGRQGFDGNYRRSFHASASSVDLTYFGNSFQNVKDMLSPSSWEQMHNIRQHGTTVIFHSDNLHSGSVLTSLQTGDSCHDFQMSEGPEDNISNTNPNESEMGQDGKSSECSVPCAASQENINMLVRNPDSVNLNGYNLQHVRDDEVVINCNGISEQSSMEGILPENLFTESSRHDLNSFVSVDQNQNTVDNQHRDRTALVNNNELIIRTNSSTQTSYTPRLKRKYSKTKQELECERLSMDFVRSHGNTTLKNLLVPESNHRTMSDYMEGLLSLESDKNGKHPMKKTVNEDSYKQQNGHWEESSKNLEANEEKDLKFQEQNRCVDILDSHNHNGEDELRKLRDDLMISIKKKVEYFRGMQSSIREEIQRNEKFGKEITGKVQKLAKANEVDKYTLHVEEMEKIMNLLLSLSGRLAKAVNFLENLPKDASPEEKRTLIAKRDKLMEQHEDARRLKESIDRRGNQVSVFLHRYLSEEEYADYDYFIRMKTKLVVDMKEIDEKINFGEEQLTALRNSIGAHMWKSANS